MVARLGLIPPSLRGNQLKKYLSFMYLQVLHPHLHLHLHHFNLHHLLHLHLHQTIAEISQLVTPTAVDVFDLTFIPELFDKLSAALKLCVIHQNYEVVMTVVELYDNIVGHEPDTDFTADKVRQGWKSKTYLKINYLK